MALPFTLKSILCKRRIMETQIFHHAKIKIFKNFSKRNQNPSRYYNSITKSQVSTQAKISSFKNLHTEIELLLPSRGQNTILYNESKHNIPTLVGKANKAFQMTFQILFICQNMTL
jgi:hypothetical protein